MTVEDIGCQVNIISGEHYGECRGSCKADDGESAVTYLFAMWGKDETAARIKMLRACGLFND